MKQVTRREEAGKIDVEISFSNKQGFVFGVRGVTLKFSSRGMSDDMHRKVSRVFNEFFHRSTLKVAISVKFNMIENLCNRANDLGDFLKNWTEQRLYAMPLTVTDVDPPPPQKQPTKKEKPKPERKRGSLAPAFQPKYTYPDDITTPEAKKKYRAMARAAARKEKANVG